MFDFKNLFQVKTIQEAVETLAANPQAKLIAGGTDIVLGMREGLFAGRDFVSIHGVEELKGISLDDAEAIHIKSGTSLRDIAESPIIRRGIPYFADAVETIGSPQIRAVATVGGNISNGFTTADSPPTLFALNALVQITGPKGNRVMPIESYYLGPERMNLGAGELLTAIVIPKKEYAGCSGVYYKYAIREAMDIAILGCAVLCRVSPDKKAIEDIRISLGAAAPVPIRIYGAEEKLKGMRIAPEMLDKAAECVRMEINPITDRRATREFRLHVAGVIAARALKQSLAEQDAVL
jgi:xanthine dehydrogenase FAD-binding subunit